MRKGCKLLETNNGWTYQIESTVIVLKKKKKKAENAKLDSQDFG